MREEVHVFCFCFATVLYYCFWFFSSLLQCRFLGFLWRVFLGWWWRKQGREWGKGRDDFLSTRTLGIKEAFLSKWGLSLVWGEDMLWVKDNMYSVLSESVGVRVCAGRWKTKSVIREFSRIWEGGIHPMAMQFQLFVLIQFHPL